MPRASSSAANTPDDDPYLSSEPDDSDPEDYVVGFGGMTKGSKKVDLDLNTKTIIFKHAIDQGYCSKQPPTCEQFLDLVRVVQMPKHGLRLSKKLLKALGSWISNNVSSRNLAGLMVDVPVSKWGTAIVYEVHIAQALVEAVTQPTFSYTDILTLQDPQNLIRQAHARLLGAMQTFGKNGNVLSMGKVIKDAMSQLTASGQILPLMRSTTRGGYTALPAQPSFHPLYTQQQPFAGAAPSRYGPSGPIPAYPAPGPSYGLGGPSQFVHSSATFPGYGPPTPLFEADKVRAEQNYEAYKQWYQHVASGSRQAQATGQPFSQDLQEDYVFNNLRKDFVPENDYIGWLIEHLNKTQSAQ